MSFMMTWILLYLAPPWLSLLPSNRPPSFTSFIHIYVYILYIWENIQCLSFLHLTDSTIISVFQEIFSAHRGFKSFLYIYVIVFCLNSLPISHLPFTHIVPFCLHAVCVCVLNLDCTCERKQHLPFWVWLICFTWWSKFHSFSCRWCRLILSGWVKLICVCVPLTHLSWWVPWLILLGHSEYCGGTWICECLWFAVFCLIPLSVQAIRKLSF